MGKLLNNASGLWDLYKGKASLGLVREYYITLQYL